MATKLLSYINFDGNAREALEFYHSVFGGTLDIATFADYASDEMPVDEAMKDKVMHGYLRGDSGVELMASDMPDASSYQGGSQISIALNTDDEAAGRDYWAKLSDGATIAVPLDASMWNSIFGMLTDKFGVRWMVDIGEMQG